MIGDLKKDAVFVSSVVVVCLYICSVSEVCVCRGEVCVCRVGVCTCMNK
jgi:hypothetical protein